MKKRSPSIRLLIEEMNRSIHDVKKSARGLSIFEIIKMIRVELGMSQQILAKRSGVPQSTISRLEKGDRDANLLTLQKIAHALSCELIIVPMLHESLSSLLKRQARKIAKKRMRYLKGTMNMEEQEPDPEFMEELLRQEIDELLQGPRKKLWDED